MHPDTQQMQRKGVEKDLTQNLHLRAFQTVLPGVLPRRAHELGARERGPHSLLQPESLHSFDLHTRHLPETLLGGGAGGVCRSLLKQTQINNADPEILHAGETAPTFPELAPLTLSAIQVCVLDEHLKFWTLCPVLLSYERLSRRRHMGREESPGEGGGLSSVARPVS